MSSGSKKNFRPESRELRVIPIHLDGEVQAGEEVAGLLLTALRHQNQRLLAGDILVIKHKIVSKAEGQFVELKTIKPSAA